MNVFLLLIVFVIGVGVGISLPRSGQRGGEFDPGHSPKTNPFLDETDSEVADDLRAEGAKSVQDRIEKRKDKIMIKAKAEGRITNDGVEELFCIGDTTASRYLNQLVDENKLKKIGNTGRGVYYEAV
ncbi:hypothetical protein KC845_02555 [Candidatus Kaiserbacteria bacterium]|nr:hypothetical protein [Candidatus Kaiserbacteria bacterium]